MNDESTVFYERVEWLGRNHANASGKSDKFYEVTVVDNGNHTWTEARRWGKYGAKGQTKALRHYSKYSAINSARGQLSAKRDKGYTNVVAPLKRLASAMDD